MSAESVTFGLATFGDVPTDDNGRLISYAEAIQQVVSEAILADQTGVDSISLGEHHRMEYSISSPETVLAGIAGQTSRIRLGTAVTVLSSDDPVRVFERFATLDALSEGRAEITLGRGSFTESFPLFGYDLQDYAVLFEERIALWAELRKEKPVTWSGTTRSPLVDADVFPKTASGALSTWVGVGGSPESVIRAATYGFPMMLATVAGDPARYARYVDLYRRAEEQAGTAPQRVGMSSPGFVADTDSEAQETFFPAYKLIRDQTGASRGWPPLQREDFDSEVQSGSMYVGSPETVARRIAQAIQSVGVSRFDMIYAPGRASQSARTRSVELYGTKVIPMIRDILGI
jgi:probable LLM family oxidoreductase